MPAGMDEMRALWRSTAGQPERLFAGSIFCRTGAFAAQQCAVSAISQRQRLVDQALGASAFGRGFPFRATPDRHARIDQTARDLMGGRRATAAHANQIENVEQQRKPLPLEGGRPEIRSGTRYLLPGETPLQPPRRLSTYGDRTIANDQIGKRPAKRRIAQPDAMRPTVIGDDEMPPARQDPVGKNSGQAIDVDRGLLVETRRRRMEDHGGRCLFGQPERGRLGGMGIGCAWESRAPSAGP